MAQVSIQVISKQRVSDHGEVLTAEREVNAMLNLVNHETERADSRFLEPACGTGNFLVPIFERKLAVIKSRYAKSQLEFERYAVIATGSIYGIDILEDNVQKCRERLFNVFDAVYSALYKQGSKDSCKESVRFILERNILLGDALTLKTARKEPEPIVFSEWVLVKGSMIKRRDYTFAELLHDHTKIPTLFSQVIVSDLGEPQFHPNPIKEYQLCHILELAHENTN